MIYIKPMVKSSFLLIPLLFLFICGSGMSKCEVLTNRVIAKFIKDLQKEGVYAAGVGGSERDGKNVYIQISFDSDQILDQNSARELIIKYTNRFLMFFNAQENMRQYMVQYPFTYKNVIFSIHGKEIHTDDPSYINIVTTNLGEIYYSVYDPAKSKGLILLHEETFEEAVKLLKHD